MLISEGSATRKNPVRDFISSTFFQDFKDFVARFQGFRAKKLRNIRNKMPKSTETFASKDFRK